MTPGGSSGSYAPANNVSGYTLAQSPNFTPEMQNLFQKLLSSASGGAGQGLDFLSKIASGDEGTFNKLEAPAYSAFDKTLGKLSGKFAQYGAGDSSAFQNAVAGQGAELSQNLQANRTQMMTDAIQKLLGHSETILGQKPFENQLIKEDPGFDIQKLITDILPIILKMLA